MMINTQIQTQTKRFYFATQSGSAIHDDLQLADALLVINELKRQGFYFCYAI